jgi:hypothetical protein
MFSLDKLFTMMLHFMIEALHANLLRHESAGRIFIRKLRA